MPATATYGPATSAPPALGYGQRGEAPIDQVNIWMRGQPWYQSLLRSWGQDPGHPHDLSDTQKQQIIRGAQANGVVVDEGHNGQEIDDNGNFAAKSHTLRNTLIVAGIAGAALLTAGAAGVFGGAAGAGATAGTGAGLAGVEGGAYGLGADALAGLGTGAMGASAVGAGAGAAAGGAAAFDAAGNFIGPSTVSEAAGSAAYGPAAAAGGGPSVTDALRYGLPTAGSIISGLIQAKATGNASDAQQKYLEEALAYQKEQDAYNRQIAANKVQLEAGRYATYSGNTAPYLAAGTAANGRMASLLGLQPSSAPPSSPTAPAALVPSMSGPTSAPPIQPKIETSMAPGAAPAPAAAPTAAPDQTVTIQGPDGSTRTVPKYQADYYISKGAKQIGTAT